MLKDLANRSKPLTNPEVILSGLTAAENIKYKNKKNVYYWLAGFILLITIVLLLAQQFSLPVYYRNHSNLSDFIKQPIFNNLPSTKQQNDVSIDPAVLTGISLQVEKEVTRLHLLLNHALMYRLTGTGDNRLAIVLEKTSLISNLPQINTMNSALNVIRLVNEPDGNLKIILFLNAGAKLLHLSLDEKSKHPELLIDFSYKSATDSTQAKEVANGVVEGQQISAVKKISFDSSVEEEYQQALYYEKIGQNDQAVTHLTKFLIKYPEHISARKSLTTLLLKQRQADKALQMIDIGLLQQPLNVDYTQLKAQILVEKGELKKALSVLQIAQPSIEENPEYHAFMAALYQRQNKFMLAEKMYERLVAIRPHNAIWWMGLGIARESLNKNNEALLAYTKANKDNDLSPDLKIYIENRIHALS